MKSSSENYRNSADIRSWSSSLFGATAALEQTHYVTSGGVRVQRSIHSCSYQHAIAQLRNQLDTQRGALLSSTFEFPGRYTRWDIGFVNPPIVITARNRALEIEALNRRGEVLLPEFRRALANNSAVAEMTATDLRLKVRIKLMPEEFSEESRSHQPSVFSVLRAVVKHFFSDKDSRLGLYGAFAYDLAFQFESVVKRQRREATTRDLVLYLPDEILVADNHVGSASIYRYDFVCRTAATTATDSPISFANVETTGGYRRTGSHIEFTPALNSSEGCDHRPGEYANIVREAKKSFLRGDLFEVVPGQVFHEPCRDSPAQIFERLQSSNPAPYGALMNLGEQEYLLAASPEMYVRVQGSRIETCPISGTIARGKDAIEDARQIRELLNSAKDEAELSMCTDVDRNDKSRVCVPGSVRVIGRRQVEMYSRLIHTVDHVEGILQPEYDALDGFLSHTWAVTVTGAPKQAAIQFIEDHEKSPRLWYGGAMGCIGFDGNLNTGLTLRAARIKNGIAQVRVGATLLMDSNPEAEEAETHLKASAVIAAIRGERSPSRPSAIISMTSGDFDARHKASSLRVLMIDHRDSFVHNLGSYFREHDVRLETLRPALARRQLQQQHYDLVILSPGPGRPNDFAMNETLALCVAKQIPVFGVCLGLQGIVEYCGGELDLLAEPMHGKSSNIVHTGAKMFSGIADEFTVGRYHSLHSSVVSDCLQIIAATKDNVVMAIEHRTLPLLAVQFHPESILSLEHNAGRRLVGNVVQYALARQRQTALHNQAGCQNSMSLSMKQDTGSHA